MANYAVNAAAGVAVITVDREGGGGVVTVSYAAGGGTATPGVDYTPVSGTLTFGLGVTVQNFTVPIIDDPSLQSDKTVNLVIASPTGGATLGVPSSAILTIGPDAPRSTPPTVTGVRLTTNRQHIVTGIVVTFSKLLNPTTAVNLLNYSYSVTTAGRDHVFGTRDNLLIPILTAVYNPSNLTVTLTLGRGIHPPTPFRFAINQLTDVPGAGIGVSDLAGNLLSGATTTCPAARMWSFSAGMREASSLPHARPWSRDRCHGRLRPLIPFWRRPMSEAHGLLARLVAAVFAPSTVLVDSRLDGRAPFRPSSFNSAWETPG